MLRTLWALMLLGAGLTASASGSIDDFKQSKRVVVDTANAELCFADGEDASVFGTDGLTFESTVKNTETPGSYGVTGRIGSVTDGVVGNYRITQAPGNARAFTVNVMPVTGGVLASLVQDAAPRFDLGFGDTVYLYGTARPIRAATLGLYRFDAERAFGIQGLRL